MAGVSEAAILVIQAAHQRCGKLDEL